MFDVNELQWFSTSAYNLGMRNSNLWKPEHIVRILSSCLDIISQYPPDLAVSISQDLALRVCFCTYMVSAALIANARAQCVENQPQIYKTARHHIAAFDRSMQPILPVVAESCREDLLKKWAILSVFDFEAATNLGQWGDLGDVAQKLKQCKSGDSYRAMLDCLILSNAPAQGNVPQPTDLACTSD